MVKPLNKEWELFGRKYRVAGAKGEKVDCNACHKQVSAAVNRLQSHLRVCPARPVLPVGLAEQIHGHTASELDESSHGDAAASLEDVNDADNALGDATSDLGDATLDSVLGGTSASATGTTTATNSTVIEASTMPAIKRQRTSPTRAASGGASSAAARRWNGSSEEFWLSSAAAASPVPSTAAYAKRRLEIEEKRLQLELVREQREQKRERYQLEILEAQARKERLAAEKEGYEARVLLALSRKQLRDQGVTEDEIDRVLPTEPLGATVAMEEARENASHAEAAAANAVAMHEASGKLSEDGMLHV